MARRLLLLSNSTNFGHGYLDHAASEIAEFFGGARRIHFIPFAVRDQLAYCDIVRSRFDRMGVQVARIPPDASSAPRAVLSAEAVFVGGGNTFRLIDLIHRTGLVDTLRRRCAEGMPYLGSSAGTVIAAPTMKTTNDMPIVQPPTFEALGLVPFQVNCHYIDADPASLHMGETREQRLMEFLEENETPVVGLREGSWIRVEEDRAILGGTVGARVFRHGSEPLELTPGADLSSLLA